MNRFDEEMDILPKDCLIASPTKDNVVSIKFLNENDAIIFFEWLLYHGKASRVE